MNPEKFIKNFCSTTRKKPTKKIDLKRLLEQEIEERLRVPS